MKNIFHIACILFLSMSLQAQNTNVTDVTKKTVKTIKDSKGEKKVVKEEKIQQRQNIELENAESKSLNKDVKETPVETFSTTTITNPDGTTRTVAIDRSSAYQFESDSYILSLDPSGYVVSDANNAKIGLLRATSNNSYIFRGTNSISIGYFDTNGNLILETYDDKSDQVTTRIFTRTER